MKRSRIVAKTTIPPSPPTIMIHKIRSLVMKTYSDLKRMSFLEGLTTVIAAVEPLASIPQLHLVYSTQSAEDLALVTSWFGVAAGSIWLIYGISIKNIPIIISASLWQVVEVALLVAILLYG